MKRKYLSFAIIAILLVCIVVPSHAFAATSNNTNGFYHEDGSYQFGTSEIARLNQYLQQKRTSKDKVYHSDGNFQVDFKFSKDVKGVKEWQLDSAQKFAIDKFYSRDIAKYDLWNYDVWLIEHLGQKSISVTYRLFIGNQLTSSGYYPG